MLITTLLLAAAIAAAWLPDWRLPRVGTVSPALPLGALALACAAFTGVADARGVVAVAAVAALGWAWRTAASTGIRRAAGTLAVLGAFALGLHLLPGFRPVVFAEGVRLSADADPMRFSAHFDAGMAGLLLLVFFCRRVQSLGEWQRALRGALPVAVVTTLGVIGLAWAIGHVRPEGNLPPFTAAFLGKMLLWTCVLEEAFFRGVVQQGLTRVRFLSGRAIGRWVPLLLASALFGLAHAAGGWAYVGLAALAGLGYGWAYARTGCIESAIAVHFLLNATHFLAFTYPRLAT